MIEIRLQPASYITRRKCFFCGETTNKDEFVAEVYEDGERTGYVVCPDYPARRGCIGQPAAVLAEHLRAQARCFRDSADALEALAVDVPEVPTMEAWKAAYDAYMREFWPEANSEPVNDADDLPF